MPRDGGAINVQVPAKLIPLFQPKRYKGAHGGRGGAKSHCFATMLVVRCFEKPTRSVCIREVQNSIKESCRQLIVDKIIDMGLDDEFQILEAEIRGRNGSLIIFKGMQSFNAANIKSLEGYDVCWVEEAQTLSAFSWRLLRPTIRKPGSEIWCTWNPRFDTDAVDDFFRGEHRHPDAICIEVNWGDNPWFPPELRVEMERDRKADPEMAGHVWDGGYEVVSEGAYYARLIAIAEKEGRIGDFPYRNGEYVRTAWDLGINDHNPIWFFVESMEGVRVVDYYEINNAGFDTIIADAIPELFIPPKLDQRWMSWNKAKALEEARRPIPFLYKDHILPHDVAVREPGAQGRARHQSLKLLGLTDLRKGAPANDETKVNAVRQVLPRVYFHNSPRVMRGVKRLRAYKRRFNELMGEYQGALHDDASHAADAFAQYAFNCPWYTPPVEEKAKAKPNHVVMSTNDDGSINVNMTVREVVEMKRRLKEMQL